MDVSDKKTTVGRHFLLSTALSAMILAPTSLSAATQGALGRTSSASMTITLVIPPKLITETASEISPVNPEIPSAAAMNETVPLCVSSNGLASYSVTASGHSNDGGFTLQNGNSKLHYDVLLWENAESNPQQLSSGEASLGLQPLSQNQSCDNGAQLALQMQQPLNKNQPLTGAMNLTISAD